MATTNTGKEKKMQQKLIPKMLQKCFSRKPKVEEYILALILAIFCFMCVASHTAIDSISLWN